MQNKKVNMKTFIKNYMKAVGVVCACMAAFPACTDMMETDSTTVGFEEDNRLDSPNDSLYSVLGILSQVQRLGDRYVLLGELRGDLMEATADAHVDIQEISNFSVSSGNEYASFYDYYNVINNCNYAIAKMDTNIVFYEDKVMIPEYAQIKVIRAWTYWQLGLATGQVSWIEEPVLSLESALKSGTNIDMFDEDIDRVNGTWGSYLMDLEQLAKDNDYEKTANAGLIQACRDVAGGTLKSIPYQPNVFAMFYNQSIFDEAGVTAVPTTWEELDAACAKIKEAGYVPITDVEAVEAFEYLSRTEGIIPAIESSHAIAYAMKYAKTLSKDKIVVINVSGRGDKDVAAIARYRGVQIYE